MTRGTIEYIGTLQWAGTTYLICGDCRGTTLVVTSCGRCRELVCPTCWLRHRWH